MQSKFKVGDKIIHFGQAHKIFRVKKEKDSEGKTVRIIMFKPYFRVVNPKSLVFSIPENSMKSSNTRKPLAKNKLKELIESLSKKPKIKEIVNVVKAREQLNISNPKGTVEILKRLWQDKKENEFTARKKDLMKSTLKKLSQEVALVFRISPAKAVKKIQKSLKRS